MADTTSSAYRYSRAHGGARGHRGREEYERVPCDRSIEASDACRPSRCRLNDDRGRPEPGSRRSRDRRAPPRISPNAARSSEVDAVTEARMRPRRARARRAPRSEPECGFPARGFPWDHGRKRRPDAAPTRSHDDAATRIPRTTASSSRKRSSASARLRPASARSANLMPRLSHLERGARRTGPVCPAEREVDSMTPQAEGGHTWFTLTS